MRLSIEDRCQEHQGLLLYWNSAPEFVAYGGSIPPLGDTLGTSAPAVSRETQKRVGYVSITPRAVDSNRWSSDMSVSQKALGSRTSFRWHLFQRHDLSPFATA